MSTIPGQRARTTELRRQQPFKSYDHMKPNRGCNMTIAMCKKIRLVTKNARRVKAGLEPKATYAEI